MFKKVPILNYIYFITRPPTLCGGGGWKCIFSDMKLPHIQSFTSMWGVVSDVLPDYWYVIHHMIEPPTTQLSGWLHFHIEVDRLLVT